MSLFDWFTGPSDASVGREVLGAYFDKAVIFPEFGYSDFDTWLVHLESKVPGYVELIGELVKSNSASTTVSQAAERVALLGNQSGGLATVSQITQAAGGRGDTINWMAAIPEIAQDTLSDVADTASELAQNVGQGVLGTANMIKYLPWILGGAGALYLIVLGKSHRRIIK
ncbi:MAG: hypothetical protein HC883_00205 [Bdellovibrionaceae bacterium]|nr:hypothetical protein [Pseudobdellovibrionaceae bacterium]